MSWSQLPGCEFNNLYININLLIRNIDNFDLHARFIELAMKYNKNMTRLTNAES